MHRRRLAAGIAHQGDQRGVFSALRVVAVATEPQLRAAYQVTDAAAAQVRRGWRARRGLGTVPQPHRQFVLPCACSFGAFVRLRIARLRFHADLSPQGFLIATVRAIKQRDTIATGFDRERSAASVFADRAGAAPRALLFPEAEAVRDRLCGEELAQSATSPCHVVVPSLRDPRAGPHTPVTLEKIGALLRLHLCGASARRL